MGRTKQKVESLKKHITKEEKDIRIKQEEYLSKLDDDKIKPLPCLSKRGKKIFNDIKKNLECISLLVNIDVYGLSILADSMDTYIEATIAKNSSTLTTMETNKAGFTKEVKSVYLNIQRDMAEIIKKYSSEFGLSPASRQKILNINTEIIDNDELEIREKYGDI